MFFSVHQMTHAQIQTSYDLCNSFHERFLPFCVVDGSPVSVRRYKAIFERDQLSAERAREPGNNLKTIVNRI